MTSQKCQLFSVQVKLYKSPLEFISLAQQLPQFAFELIVNDTQENIDLFITEHKVNISKNLTIYPRQSDVAPFYNRASLVLNLTNKKQAVETFGLTALEAMSAGLPVIVPTEGGIAEMVDDGVNGYKIDVTNLKRIEYVLMELLSDKTRYIQMADNALYRAKQFNADDMIEGVERVLVANSK